MEWSAKDYVENAAFVSQYGEEVLALLKPVRGEHILDLGCGEGVLAEQMAASGCKVIAIDASADMIAAAQKRGLNAYRMPAEEMDFKDMFDAVFSNAALHWMQSPDKVIRNVFAALKPDGRFCAEMGASGNVQIITSAIYKELAKMGLNGDDYNPWYFPTQERYRALLESAGFRVETITSFPRSIKLPTDVAGWLKTFAKPFFRDIPSAQLEDFIEAVKAGLADRLQDKDGIWYADYVRLRFSAVKPAKAVLYQA